MSTINWFPGHMHKARKEIAKVIDEVDVVIEVLDARLPQSSENPLVDSLRKGKPVVKLLNKADLADPKRTKEWLDFFNAKEGILAVEMDTSQKNAVARIPQLCKQMAPTRSKAGRPVRAMIMGIPNVGKSTLINALLGRKIAKVGNEPAVTKSQTRFTSKNGMALSDTPGILWPKIEDPDSGYRLAASGAIKDTAIEYEDIALFAADFALTDYPEYTKTRFKLKELPESGTELLETIGRKRGALRPGGIIDMHKASEVLLHELRGGKLGRVTFETVAEWEEKIRLAEIARLEAEAAALAEEELRAQQSQQEQQ